MHDCAGLSEDQCEREKHAQPRDMPTGGQESGLCHSGSIAWMTGFRGAMEAAAGPYGGGLALLDHDAACSPSGR